MKDTRVTAYGNLVADPEERTDRKGGPFTTFRIGSTPYRRLPDGSWGNLATSFFSVVVFGTQAANVAKSLRKGEPVVVTGSLEIRQWQTRERETRVDPTINAEVVGHDLTRGQTVFRRLNKGQSLGDDRTSDPNVMAALEETYARSVDGIDGGRPANVDANGEVHGWPAPMSVNGAERDAAPEPHPVAEPGDELRVEDQHGNHGLGDPETDDYEIAEAS